MIPLLFFFFLAQSNIINLTLFYDNASYDRPQDAVKYDDTAQVVIFKDTRLIRGDGCGRVMNLGHTVYIDCGSFQDAFKDSRVTQCYSVVEAIINDNEVLIKTPGLKWIPPPNAIFDTSRAVKLSRMVP
jgi:hypothetical protein